jgi:hypothetical protein
MIADIHAAQTGRFACTGSNHGMPFFPFLGAVPMATEPAHQ